MHREENIVDVYLEAQRKDAMSIAGEVRQVLCAQEMCILSGATVKASSMQERNGDAYAGEDHRLRAQSLGGLGFPLAGLDPVRPSARATGAAASRTAE